MFETFFLLGMCLGVELLGHAVILYLTFWGTAKLFSTAAAHFTFPPAMYYGLAFSIFLVIFFILPSFFSNFNILAYMGCYPSYGLV